MSRPSLDRPALAYRPVGQGQDGRPVFSQEPVNVWLMLTAASASAVSAGGIEDAVGDLRCIMRTGEVGIGWRVKMDGHRYEVEGAAPARQWDRRAFEVVTLRLIRSRSDG